MTDITIFPVETDAPEDFRRVIERIGADQRSLRYLTPKRRTLLFYVSEADYRAAAFIKQELLSRGGDAAVAKHVIDGKTEKSDVLIMGTYSQLRSLIEKMKAMDCWGLREIREGLDAAAANMNVHEWTLPLPGGRTLTLNRDTRIMGILNVTPDSFYAGSRVEGASLIERAAGMLEDGADILDVGAESTRPGSEPVPEDEELSRLIPAITALRREFPDAVISADTYRGRVALSASDAGADVINDVSGFEWDSSMLECAAKSGLPYVLSCPNNAGGAEDIIGGLHRFFRSKLLAAEDAGLDAGRVILDPGIGFGKDANDNFAILNGIESLRSLGRPVMTGHSRKRFTALGATDAPAESEERLTVTAVLSALLEGKAEIVRVHDVKANRLALLSARAVREAGPW